MTSLFFVSPLFAAAEILLGFCLTIFVGAVIATVGDRVRPPRR